MHEAILRAEMVCISANPKLGNPRNASSGSAGLFPYFYFRGKADLEGGSLLKYVYLRWQGGGKRYIMQLEDGKSHS